MFNSSTPFAQLERSVICMIHTFSAPTLSHPKGVAHCRLKQQLRFVAQRLVLDIGKEVQALLQMTDGFVMGRTTRGLFAGFVQVVQGLFVIRRLSVMVGIDYGLSF